MNHLMSTDSLDQLIREASDRVGKTWPLYSFVTSNPLSGYEGLPFAEAVLRAGRMRGADVLPGAALFRKALMDGEIKESALRDILKENGLNEPPEYYLEQMDAATEESGDTEGNALNRMTAKWVMAFLDEGLAEWAMPYKAEGFYHAWKKLAQFDRELPRQQRRDFPPTAREAIRMALAGFAPEEQNEILEQHLAALPGWAGYVRHRQESGTSWQKKFPMDLEQYLAVRLTLARKLGVKLLAEKKGDIKYVGCLRLKYLWLEAWEQTWQDTLKTALSGGQEEENASRRPQPDAQMVFCIDTRSEPMRRQIEQQGNYETFGYAGFFGIAMDYEDPANGLSRKSCPPILPSAYRVRESHAHGKEKEFAAYAYRRELDRFRNYFLRRIKNMLPSAFGYVEAAGAFYGASLLARTWLPAWVYRVLRKSAPAHEHICEPVLREATPPGDGRAGLDPVAAATDTDIPLDQQVAIVKGAFDLMGWRDFAPLVLFVGHGSHSANNPFASSLDCGACAASPGRHNARVLARLANRREVRSALMYDHNILIPESTHFLAAEHNTTTEEITLFDRDLPPTHSNLCYHVMQDLHRAREAALARRLGSLPKPVIAAERLAGDWSETRPEWGLAKNAGFVIGPRELTRDLNLDGRCFLHSYRWDLDTDGTALEAIMQGPMVVTQWINNHYFFATIDPERFGGGDKITHNITGHHGVLTGNGGDLKSGLPFQSLYASDSEAYHQPLRLTVCIQAPRERVGGILSKNEHLKTLLDNTWIYLMVLEPGTGEFYRYDKAEGWTTASAQSPGKYPTPTPRKTELEVAGMY